MVRSLPSPGDGAKPSILLAARTQGSLAKTLGVVSPSIVRRPPGPLPALAVSLPLAAGPALRPLRRRRSRRSRAPPAESARPAGSTWLGGSRLGAPSALALL